MKVAWIGVGRMGNPMATSVLKAGHKLTVHDMRREAATNLLEAGAQWASTPAEAAVGQDVVMMCLPMPRDVEAVCLGGGSLVEAVSPSTVVVDSSTNSVETIRRLHQSFADEGLTFMDAPVSGGVAGAISRDLCVMASGDEATFKRIRPVFDAMGDKVVYCGQIGNGTVCKLAHQLFSAIIGQGAAEILTMGVKAGVPLATLVDAVSKSAGAKNPPLHRWKTQPVTSNFDPDSLTFTLALSHKDIRLANELGRQYGVPLHLGSTVEQAMIEAVNRGWGSKKAEVVRQLQEERSKVDLSKA
ncbi:MAG: NAD(P)-dependent oxidoreductase [Chloroflexi bacterium]|nr:NAD(P)-dependent oxidoreductase [Chloroflexota bacterium]